MTTYALIDSGNERKLERFGPYLISRPSAQAVWKPQLSEEEWNKADAIFTREPENIWKRKTQLASDWVVEIAGIKFKISPTDFGHLGVFPEQRDFWEWIQTIISQAKQSGRTGVKVLNLFAYSGELLLISQESGYPSRNDGEWKPLVPPESASKASRSPSGRATTARVALKAAAKNVLRISGESQMIY